MSFILTEREKQQPVLSDTKQLSNKPFSAIEINGQTYFGSNKGSQFYVSRGKSNPGMNFRGSVFPFVRVEFDGYVVKNGSYIKKARDATWYRKLYDQAKQYGMNETKKENADELDKILKHSEENPDDMPFYEKFIRSYLDKFLNFSDLTFSSQFISSPLTKERLNEIRLEGRTIEKQAELMRLKTFHIASTLCYYMLDYIIKTSLTCEYDETSDCFKNHGRILPILHYNVVEKKQVDTYQISSMIQEFLNSH